MLSPERSEEFCAGISEAVLARGRDRVLIGRALLGSNGVAALTAGADTAEMVELLELVVLGIVWYVRTGKRSTTLLGARHRLRRILERRSKRA